jgi:hypothetical protein
VVATNTSPSTIAWRTRLSQPITGSSLVKANSATTGMPTAAISQPQRGLVFMTLIYRR